MNTTLLIILISSLFSIVMFLFCSISAEIYHSKEKSIYNKVFSKKFLFYNKKRYSMIYLHKRSNYLNVLLWNFFILIMILFFFLEKGKEMKEYNFVMSEYEKKVHLSIFLTSALGLNLIFVIFATVKFMIQKKVKSFVKDFTIAEIKNLVNKLKDNDFFEFFYLKPCYETFFISRFLAKMDKIETSYVNKNKEYKYLFYFIFYFLFSINITVRHKWINDENISNPERANIIESINLFNIFFW